MIEILPLQPGQVADAKHVIAAVAQRIFEPEKSTEDFADLLDEDHELDDVDDYQQVYTSDRGLFLVILDDGRVIGTGAVRRLDDRVAELKRIWLLETHHGRGIGFRLVSMLLQFAREHGYESIRLHTSRQQARAIAFYHKVGFHDIPGDPEDPDDVSMELEL